MQYENYDSHCLSLGLKVFAEITRNRNHQCRRLLTHIHSLALDIGIQKHFQVAIPSSTSSCRLDSQVYIANAPWVHYARTFTYHISTYTQNEE